VTDQEFLLVLDHCPRQDLAQQQHHLRLAEPQKKIQVPRWQNLDQDLLSKMLCYRMGADKKYKVVAYLDTIQMHDKGR
jgi:hypothetical protein